MQFSPFSSHLYQAAEDILHTEKKLPSLTVGIHATNRELICDLHNLVGEFNSEATMGNGMNKEIKRGLISAPTGVDSNKKHRTENAGSPANLSSSSHKNEDKTPFQGKTDPNERNPKQGKDTVTPSHPRDIVSTEEADCALASALQNECLKEDIKLPGQDQFHEKDCPRPYPHVGKALEFVEAVVGLQRNLLTPPVDPDVNYCNFATVSEDDLVFLVERFYEKLADFRREGKPIDVDIGYHYTQRSNMLRIRTDGLMTRAEREENQVQSRFNGATFGDGIYTACNPFAYYEFAGGETGLFVLRLKGRTEQHETSSELDQANTVLGRSGTDMVTVLRSSDQCVALIQFASGVVSVNDDTDVGNKMVYRYHRMLQDLVDIHFNEQRKTQVEELAPSKVRLRVAASIGPTRVVSTFPKAAPVRIIWYKAPESLICTSSNRERVVQEIPASAASTTECKICWEDFKEGGMSIALVSTCFHEFHLACILDSLEYSCKCPLCRKPTQEPMGQMPSGFMAIDYKANLTCDGFQPGAIVIAYNIESGMQKSYHENPGVAHSGTHRVAYLPDNDDGRSLLKRLVYAFEHGLTFTVGTSLTSGVSDTIIWASIHHKTSLSGGPHGFPDEGYFFNVNEELNAMHVPSADDL